MGDSVVFHAQHHGVGDVGCSGDKAAQPRLRVDGCYHPAGKVLVLPHPHHVVMGQIPIYGCVSRRYGVEAHGVDAGVVGRGVGDYRGKAASVGDVEPRRTVSRPHPAYPAVGYYVGKAVAVEIAQICAGGARGGAPVHASAHAHDIKRRSVVYGYSSVFQIVACRSDAYGRKELPVVLTLVV